MLLKYLYEWYLKQNVVRQHTSWCVATPFRHTDYGVSAHQMSIFQYFLRIFDEFPTILGGFLASSETFRQLLVVFTPKICIIKKFGVSTHILKTK